MKKRIVLISIILTVIIGIVVTVVIMLPDKTQDQHSEHVHNFSEWEIIENATCNTSGLKQRVCDCGEIEECKLNPLGHNYANTEEWSEEETQFVSACCDICGNRSEVIYNGLYLDEAGEMYLWNCPSTFYFDVKCTEGEEYVRQHVWVMDSFLRSLNPVQYSDICETLTVESLENDTYRISPTIAYENAKQYAIRLGENVEFCHMVGNTATFRTEGEAKQIVEYNQNILFLKDLEEKNPGYYPYELTYDSETRYHTLLLSSNAVVSNQLVGQVLCIGDCRNFEEIRTAEGEIVFGKIERISESENGVILTLSNPTLSEVYDKINVSVGTLDSITAATTSEDFQEELLYQVASSEGFAEAVTTARMAAFNYAAANGMKAKDSPFDISNFKITHEAYHSDKDAKKPFVRVTFKITYDYEIPIEKGDYEGSVNFDITFYVEATYVIQAADTNFQVKDGKHWWNGTYLDINIELSQIWEAELDIQAKLNIHDTDPQLDYIITDSGRIHRYSCITCEKLRQDKNNLVSLDYVKKIPNYVDNECKICKPFTLTDSLFILNLDSNILHCGNCEDAKRITKAEVIVYELYPLGGAFKNCDKCKPQNNSGLDNFIKNSLESSEWSAALDKVTESIKNELKAKDAGASQVDKSKPVATVNVCYVFDLNFYLQPKFDFDLEASLQFNYKMRTRDIYIIRSQIDANNNYSIQGYFDKGSKDNTNENEWTFDLQGKATARLGMMAEMTFGFVGINDAYIGLYAETGLYAKLNGILHLDSDKENYYGANLKAGVYFDTRVTYELFDIIEPGSIQIWKKDIPLFESGDSRAYYGFTYDGAEVVIENAWRGQLKKEFLQAAYYNLETMKKGNDTLSWFGDNDYSFTYRFEDAEGNKLTYLGAENDEILIYDGAPEQFTAYLYVKVVDEISPKNLLEYLGTYNEDGCSFMMDELCVVVKYNNEHLPEVIKIEASDPTDVSKQYLTGDEITFTVITNKYCYGVSIYCDNQELSTVYFGDNGDLDIETGEITYTLNKAIDEAGSHNIVAYPLDDKWRPIKNEIVSKTMTITFQNRNYCMPPKITTDKDQTILIGQSLTLAWEPSPYPVEGITYSVTVDYRGSAPWEYPLAGVPIDGTSYIIDASVFSKPGRYGITVYPITSNPAITVPEGCYSVIGIDVVENTSEGLTYTLTDLIYGGTGYVVSGIGTCTDTEIVIPSEYNGEKVTRIGHEAFYECISLTSITIPDSVTYIGFCAFFGCSSLTSINIPDSVTSIGAAAFYDCSNLTSVTIGDSVTSIGNYAFYNCSNLTSVTIPDSVTSIGEWAFAGCSSLKSITIPDSVTSIGNYAFSSCSSLTSIIYEGTKDQWKNVEKYYEWNIGSGEFIVYCTDGSLTKDGEDIGNPSVSFSEGLEYISNGDGTCYVSGIGTCTDTEIVIPSEYNGEKVTSIGHEAFYECSSLTSITIPDGVTSIDDSTFYACSSLTSITIPDSVTSIEGCAFYGCSSLTSITIPHGVTSIGVSTFYSCNSLTSIAIPDSVTSIGLQAFGGCSSLTSIAIPDGVTSIGERAFYGCSSLTSITIPDGVTSLGEWVFYGCKNLTTATIPDSVTSIGGDAFRSCTSLTSITIPDSVTSIGEWAFAWCKGLTSITIPASVTSIGHNAFYASARLITFDGTIAQWNALTKDSYWDYDIPVTKVVCSDGVFQLNQTHTKAPTFG